MKSYVDIVKLAKQQQKRTKTPKQIEDMLKYILRIHESSVAESVLDTDEPHKPDDHYLYSIKMKELYESDILTLATYGFRFIQTMPHYDDNKTLRVLFSVVL